MPVSKRVIYTANAHVTGGRAQGHGRASDGALEVDLRAPVEMGGGGGTNPEQLFAVGYAHCERHGGRRRLRAAGCLTLDKRHAEELPWCASRS